MAYDQYEQVPDHWLPYFEKLGVEPNRRSFREVARRAGVDVGRIRRGMRGEGTSDRTIEILAEVFGISIAEVQQLRGEQPAEPFELPFEARYLTRTQRDAVRAVVQGMLEGRSLPDDMEAGDVGLATAQEGAAARLKRVQKGDQRGEVGQGGG